MALLIGAGLFIHSFVRVIEQDLGADPSDLLTFDFRLTQAETIKPFGRYRGMGLWDISPVPAQRVERVLERLEQVPEIAGVAATNLPPFRDQTMRMPFLIEGRPAPPSAGSSGIGFTEGQQFADYFAVTRGFFGVMKVPLLKGRDFNDRDNEDAPLVIVINQTLARRYFPNEDPIGKRITLDWVPDERPREVVGVVADTPVTPLQREQAAAVYVPHLQQTSKFTGPYWFTRAGMYFVLRTSVDPRSLEASLKSVVAEVDRNTPVADIRTMKDTIDHQVGNLRLYMLLIAIFATVATVLAATGIYCVMAYSVAERRREIGIRIALGAGSRDVLAMMFRQASFIIGIGLLIGLGVALGVSRLLQSTLYGVSSTDLPTYAAVAVVLLLTATIACLIPTKRAIAVDPTVSLKND
jgi:predicted permease